MNNKPFPFAIWPNNELRKAESSGSREKFRQMTEEHISRLEDTYDQVKNHPGNFNMIEEFQYRGIDPSVPRDVFHHVGAGQHIGVFGDKGQYVLSIHPRHEGGEKGAYHVTWLGAHPNESGTLFDHAPKIKRALMEVGARSLKYNPIKDGLVGSRTNLFKRFASKYTQHVASLPASQLRDLDNKWDEVSRRIASHDELGGVPENHLRLDKNGVLKSLPSLKKNANEIHEEPEKLETLGYAGKPRGFSDRKNFNSLIPYRNPDGNIAHSGRFGNDGEFEVHLRPMTEGGDEYHGTGRKHPYLEWAGRKNWTAIRPPSGSPKFHSVLPHLFSEMIRHGYHGDNLHFDVLNPGTDGGDWRQDYFSDIANKWGQHVAPRIEGYIHSQQTLPDSEKWGKSAAWTRKEGQNPKGGLNARGRASAKRQGHNLKPPVKSGDNPRRASFLARMGGSPGPEYDEHGKPTRLLLALRVWGASSKADAKKKAHAMLKRLKNKKKNRGSS